MTAQPRDLHAPMYVKEAIGRIQTPRPENQAIGFSDGVARRHYE
ncbi:MAG TPA: hypothetical protein VFI54_14530 [Solirubrobacteraceae bacterium]|nr:hypothetical protein [Solirubrobacteraceae bacterium]